MDRQASEVHHFQGAPCPSRAACAPHRSAGIRPGPQPWGRPPRSQGPYKGQGERAVQVRRPSRCLRRLRSTAHRMKTERHGPSSRRGMAAGAGRSVSNELIWAPKKLRDTVTSRPPSSFWPPCFWPVCAGYAGTDDAANLREAETGRGPTLGAGRQEDQAGARAPDRPPRVVELLQLGNQTPALGHEGHRGALATGDDESVAAATQGVR